MTAADLIRGAKLRTDEWPVCVDPDLADEYQRLQRAKVEAVGRDADSFAGGHAAAVQSQIDDLLEAVQAATVVLVLRALPREEYRALVDANPPRKDADGNVIPRDQRFGADYDGFFNALARRSVVGARIDEETIEPLDAATVDVLIDEKLSDGDWEELTSRCSRLNRSTVDVPFSLASSRKTRRSSAS